MKSTDIARIDRERKRAEKKQQILERKQSDERSVGDFINDLYELFFFDQNKIYNINMSVEILELLEEMKAALPDKQWDNVIRKAVKKTKVIDKDTAITELKTVGEIQ